jgi:ureidoglycolate dehydrogenase (NAD+)
MVGEDMSTPRRLGHFFIVINPEAFVPGPVFEAGIAAYLADLRAEPSKPGANVMASGDREWATADKRSADGIPIAPPLMAEFREIATDLKLDMANLTPTNRQGRSCRQKGGKL